MLPKNATQNMNNTIIRGSLELSWIELGSLSEQNGWLLNELKNKSYENYFTDGELYYKITLI